MSWLAQTKWVSMVSIADDVVVSRHGSEIWKCFAWSEYIFNWISHFGGHEYFLWSHCSDGIFQESWCPHLGEIKNPPLHWYPCLGTVRCSGRLWVSLKPEPPALFAPPPLLCVTCIASHSPLVWHMPTPWQPCMAAKLICHAHTCKQALVGLKTRTYRATDAPPWTEPWQLCLSE